MSTYPNGMPVFWTQIWNSGSFTPDAATSKIIDNVSPINRATMRISIGEQISLIQNFVNAQNLGYSDLPITSAYITNSYINSGNYGAGGVITFASGQRISTNDMYSLSNISCDYIHMDGGNWERYQATTDLTNGQLELSLPVNHLGYPQQAIYTYNSVTYGTDSNTSVSMSDSNNSATFTTTKGELDITNTNAAGVVKLQAPNGVLIGNSINMASGANDTFNISQDGPQTDFASTYTHNAGSYINTTVVSPEGVVIAGGPSSSISTTLSYSQLYTTFGSFTIQGNNTVNVISPAISMYASDGKFTLNGLQISPTSPHVLTSGMVWASGNYLVIVP